MKGVRNTCLSSARVVMSYVSDPKCIIRMCLNITIYIYLCLSVVKKPFLCASVSFEELIVLKIIESFQSNWVYPRIACYQCYPCYRWRYGLTNIYWLSLTFTDRLKPINDRMISNISNTLRLNHLCHQCCPLALPWLVYYVRFLCE